MALLLAIGAPQVHAQTPTDDWADNGGTVEVSETTLRIREGESATYRVRLTKPLPIDEDGMRVGGWWVMAQVDGATRIDGVYDRDDDGENDISWVPSVGWEFNPSDWPEGEDESKDSDRYKLANFIGVAVCNSIPHETRRGPARLRPSPPWSP